VTTQDHLDKPYRQSIRLRGFDYAGHGAYYVTICTHEKKCIFGKVSNGEVSLSGIGAVVQEEWLETFAKRSHIEMDEFVVMPNHFHGIVWIIFTGDEKTGSARRAPTAESYGAPVSGSVPTIVRAFKSAVTRRVNLLRDTSSGPVWQRNYYEHVICNEEDLNRIRRYIIDNPGNWDIDEENPHRICR
jgi:REP element-mobilizing transposase RayT